MSSEQSLGSKHDPKRLLLDHLKRHDSVTVSVLAQVLAVTTVAIRQHLEQLEASGLVKRVAVEKPSGERGRGRPAAAWSLTAMAIDLFPDRHADLTIELIASIREAVGQEGLDQVLAQRSTRQRAAYAKTLGETPVKIRAKALSKIRSDEGYMAEVVDEGDLGLVLVEHHCPICDAAAECQGLCRDELETFQELFLGVAIVERESHLLSGDSRCTYRIQPLS